MQVQLPMLEQLYRYRFCASSNLHPCDIQATGSHVKLWLTCPVSSAFHAISHRGIPAAYHFDHVLITVSDNHYLNVIGTVVYPAETDPPLHHKTCQFQTCGFANFSPERHANIPVTG